MSIGPSEPEYFMSNCDAMSGISMVVSSLPWPSRSADALITIGGAALPAAAPDFRSTISTWMLSQLIVPDVDLPAGCSV